MPNEKKDSPDDNQGHGHKVTIIVNTREVEVDAKELSFDEVLHLAYPDPPTGPNIVITITYRRGDDHHPEGSQLPGQTVKVKEHMIFNVVVTDKS
jgi:hypothetical protein